MIMAKARAASLPAVRTPRSTDVANIAAVLRLADRHRNAAAYPLFGRDGVNGGHGWAKIDVNDPKRTSERIRGTDAMEYRAVTPGLLRPNVGRADHLAPLLGFVGDELAELG